jgi:putative acyl-CoA dehydrogenase
MAKQPESVEAYFEEVSLAAGADTRLDEATARLRKELSNLDDIQYRARRIVESMALVLQGSLLQRYGNPAVADAFCASRLADDRGIAFGTLPTGLDTAAIIDRARPSGGTFGD